MAGLVTGLAAESESFYYAGVQADAASPPPPREGQEIVHRPDPGLGRGRFEAPPWLFVVVAVVAALLLGLFVYRSVKRAR